jgi:hypothetical protein
VQRAGAGQKFLRLLRDSIICVGFLFVGFLYFTRAWPTIECLVGAALAAIGCFIFCKINIVPFADLSPRETFRAYFARPTGEISAKRAAWRRLWAFLFATPYVLFVPIVLIVKTMENLQGFMVLSAVFAFLGLAFYGVSFFKPK